MKDLREKPPIATMANSKANYNDNSKQFAGVRKDLNALISLLREQIGINHELNSWVRKIGEQFTKNKGGR